MTEVGLRKCLYMKASAGWRSSFPPTEVNHLAVHSSENFNHPEVRAEDSFSIRTSGIATISQRGDLNQSITLESVHCPSSGSATAS